ncbi:MAG TPA: M56 family metallopeptidase [Brevundimonas sp.]|jgi:beta-lactamase regulating signal transducer with metallopeptidase domain|uniref:M56 family metallopeptidase n=1 Tax=Brevundimonas sp. TaxID=1871086 RepID=UPI002E152A89|nr:M56 family metallopeptidase [Brevundimonas sp.]
MSAAALLLLSLGLSVGVAALALAAGAALDRSVAEARLRDRVWAVLLWLPLAPPATASLALLALPRRVIETPALAGPPVAVAVSSEPAAPMAAPALSSGPGSELLVPVLTVLLLGVTALALGRLALRMRRLARLTASAHEAPEPLRAEVAAAARALGAPTPRVRLSPETPEPLLTGLRRPRLILPEGFRPDRPEAAAVLSHELAHLRRGDHRAVWLEEGLSVLLAFNPLVPVIRARRAAVREEACDALALAGAPPDLRRAYARSLLEALRARTTPVASLPALTFTGTPGSQAMRRLQAIVSPPPAARRRLRIAAAGALSGLAVVAVSAGVGLAHGRAPVVVAPSTPQTGGADWTRRYTEADARAFQLYCAAPAGNPDRMFGCDANLWMAAEREQRAPTGAFCPPAADEAGLARIAGEGRPHVLAAGRVSGSAGDAARQALIAAFPCAGPSRAPDAGRLTARSAALTAEWEAARGADSAAEEGERRAQRPWSVSDVRANCFGGRLEIATCTGFIFGVTIRESERPQADRAFCAPEGETLPRDYPDRVRAAMSDIAPASRTESAHAYVSRAIARAYPCPAQAAAGAGTSIEVSLRVEYPAGYSPAQGHRLELSFVRPDEAPLGRSVAFDLNNGLPPEVRVDLDADFFHNRVAPNLSARIVAGDGRVIALQEGRQRPMIVRGNRAQAFGVVALTSADASSPA